MARVVVLMPVYNGGIFLHNAIKSILDQSYTDFQLLIIDDASTDKSSDIIDSFCDPRINYQRNNKNIGLARTLNRGLELADCEYLIRMDADDVSLPRRLEWQVSFMDNNPSLGISGTWLKIFGSKKSRGIVKYLGNHEAMRICLLFCTPMAHPTVIIRYAEWMKENLFYDPVFNRTEDFELWSRAVQKIRLGNLSKVAYRYRRHSASVTCANQGEMISQYRVIIKKHLDNIGVFPSPEELDLHTKIGLQGKVNSLAELQMAEEWLLYIMQQAVLAGYEKICVHEAISLIWYRFARNAAWLGREGEKACLSSDLLIPKSVLMNERILFKAAVLFHSFKGKEK